ncbi:MAG: UvrD-helicase domain-containing protein [Gammaproteobacteria bacterium]|nr:UvrD-helicase domain-containing protein [Gammaproteobacteria bacterium]
MEESEILNPLNEAQRKAVTAPPGPVLVLAGAGSGKTRTLVHRIAWLIQEQSTPPWSIIAMTFTNKSAREMQSRIEKLLSTPSKGLWIGTFHSLGLRMLRQNWQDAGLTEQFEVIDNADQLRQIKKSMEELKLDEKAFPPKQMLWRINACKDDGYRAYALPKYLSKDEVFLSIYKDYEKRCQQLGLVDFGELLLRPYELLKNNQIIREYFQNKFEHVLIDEFQDANQIQFQFAKLLSAGHQSIFAVGDDDQSIYGWRGAKVENMLGFNRTFPSAYTFRLEQNYRSSGHILQAANAIIRQNSRRLGKKLWTNQADGESIRVYCSYTETDEARFVISAIQSSVSSGKAHDEHVILYRSNAQSRAFEEQLIAQNIPYSVYGGMRFFERAEIKNALAYLKLAVNCHSDPSFDRVVNMPPRNIGSRTMDSVHFFAAKHNVSLWEASGLVIGDPETPPRRRQSLEQFRAIIGKIATLSKELQLDALVEQTIYTSGLIDHYSKDRGEAAISRIENLKELITAARSYTPEQPLDNAGQLKDELNLFLNHTTLEAGPRGTDEASDNVQLMSLHSAKGLEFETVFLCGMEDGLFPHQLSISEGSLEEERRLCYVGITRAKQQLYLCYSQSRNVFGKQMKCTPSRFLAELPMEILSGTETLNIQQLDFHEKSMNADPNISDDCGNILELGCSVLHKQFGEGTLIQFEGSGASTRVQINFPSLGKKWLVLNYARLRRV